MMTETALDVAGLVATLVMVVGIGAVIAMLVLAGRATRSLHESMRKRVELMDKRLAKLEREYDVRTERAPLYKEGFDV